MYKLYIMSPRVRVGFGSDQACLNPGEQIVFSPRVPYIACIMHTAHFNTLRTRDADLRF